ncbi:arsenate reductase (glutaredoxin) [Maritalea mediterranea]|uniref:Arsenate reductase n=1 Tax=Maritalea mediterranea TaxID=2909667 RepID=A0ABS9E7J2_9HYPH|nr:arsenate reductase (glutaredoxin) [Maritalea mediterranea]MCF4097740.1 arsenate reductase (glutaredoxin) [Maritalea mediterranea]
MTVTIYHNPNCGTSRNVLEMIRRTGEEPNIVFYLETPPTREELEMLLVQMRMPARGLLRQKGTPYDALGLEDETLSEDQLIDAMMMHPILINRPIVISENGAALCRPSEKVLDLLKTPLYGSFTKEDGQVVQL